MANILEMGIIRDLVLAQQVNRLNNDLEKNYELSAIISIHLDILAITNYLMEAGAEEKSTQFPIPNP